MPLFLGGTVIKGCVVGLVTNYDLFAMGLNGPAAQREVDY